MDVISAWDAEAVAMNRSSCSRLLCLYSLRLKKHSSVIVTQHRNDLQRHPGSSDSGGILQ